MQGYISQTPLPKDPLDCISDENVWNQYNDTIDNLNHITGENFDRFKIFPNDDEFPVINLTAYRQKIGGIISQLHAKYFFDEPAPFSGTPKTVITQSQQQSQNIHVQVLLDIQSRIDKNLDQYNEGTKEKGFLQSLKDKLSTVTSITQLFALILKIANEFGLNPKEILKLLNLT